MSDVKPKRMTVRELRQKVDRLTAERDRAVKRAARYRRAIRDMEETRRLNLQELWEEATLQPYDDHEIDDVLIEVEELRWKADAVKRIFQHLSEEARNEWLRVVAALNVGERPDNGTP